MPCYARGGRFHATVLSFIGLSLWRRHLAYHATLETRLQNDSPQQAGRDARRSPCGTGDPHAGGFLRGEPAKGRWAPAPRPRDLDRRVRSRVCRARAGSRAGPRRYGACPRLARRRPQVELQVEVQPGLVRRVRQRPAPVGDQPPRVPRPSAPSPPPDRREFSLARRAPSAAVRRVRGFWSGGPPVPQGLLHAAFLANGRSAVKPGLFCEHSGRVAQRTAFWPVTRLASVLRDALQQF